MEYPYYPNPQSQPFPLYNLQGAPTLGQNDDDNQHRNPQTDDIQDTLASLVRTLIIDRLKLSPVSLTVARGYRVISPSTPPFAFRTPPHRSDIRHTLHPSPSRSIPPLEVTFSASRPSRRR